MLVKDFCEAYKAKKFMTTKSGINEKSEYIRNELEIKNYIPFREKRRIAEMVVAQNITEIDGVKKYDAIDGYVSLVVASIAAHTNLQWSKDPVSDYDALAESGLLMEIISEFQGSHQEIDLLLHMALDMEMEDNEVSAIIGRFLNKISVALDDVVDVVKNKMEGFDLSNILGEDFNKEDLAKLSSFLNKLK